MTRSYRYISGDSHVEVKSDFWLDRVPEKYRNQAPHVIQLPDGSDAWLIEGQPLRTPSFDLYGGKGREVWFPFGQNYVSTPGTGDAHQRLREQDRDGIDAEILFPNQACGPYLWRNIRDDNAYKATVRAYNDWLAEDYCSADPERLLGLGIIPQTNLQDALDEMQHIAKLGLKGVTLGIFPSGKGYPTPEDDVFWKAALDMKMPITVHIEFNRTGPRGGPLMKYAKELPGRERLGDNADLVFQVNRFGRLGSLNAVQMVLTRVFERFPDLKLFFAETQIGWIPWFAEQSDIRYGRHWYWASKLNEWEPLPKLPTEYVRDHIYWGFQEDRVGVDLRHHKYMRVDRLIWATDFPHQESEYPNSMRVLDEVFEGVSADEKKKIVAGNVIEFFHLDATVADE